MDVHKILGCGFSETGYQEALAKELRLRAIPYVREARLPVTYKGELLETVFRADFLCYDDIIVELKALDEFGNIELAQVLNYLRASNKRRGLILNFGSKSLQFRRVVLNW